jgi:ribose transport system ATP-binding protein
MSSAMNSGILLQMRDISKSFPGVRALEKVNFELKSGEIHVLLGENGAGKSTLMKILSGAYRLDEGQIFLEGALVYIQNPHHAQQLGISSIYQEFNLVPHLSVSANIFLGREPLRWPGILDKRIMRKQTAGLLDQLAIRLDPAATISSLSVAEQQMVEVAKALAFDSKILIMDEPTSALTAGEIRALFNLIHRLRQRGVGIVYISHRLEEIFELGDRVTVLRDGRFVATRKVAEVTAEELIRLMADRQLKEGFPSRRVAPGPPVLQVSHLSTRHRLKDINFVLHAGEILGVAGLLGSGRSALARALFGVDKIATGSIRVHDQERRIDSPTVASRHGLGFLAEDRKRFGLVLGLSVKQNITLANTEEIYRCGVLSPSREQHLAEQCVAQLKIKTPHLEQPVLFLSGGNQQKVVLGKWLARQADILIFDEPTRGIDVAAKADIYELMNRLTEQGVGILMISSDLPEILGLSDRILVMRQGQIAAQFSRLEATPEKVLKVALGEVT